MASKEKNGKRGNKSLVPALAALLHPVVSPVGFAGGRSTHTGM